jgi:hypothetical protein
MPGVTKVHGYTEEGQFYGRDLLAITISGLTPCPAAVDGKIAWPELDEAIRLIQQRHTVSVVGAFEEADEEVNLIVEGVGGQTVAEIATETGLTIAEYPL